MMDNPPVTIEFRDGEHTVPHHVGMLMRGLETHTMTYDQAIKVANQRLLTDRLNAAQRQLVNSHFRRS